ncbi:MAG TPA: 50S ribosomal protein L23 [Acidimicrobiales bacterium]
MADRGPAEPGVRGRAARDPPGPVRARSADAGPGGRRQVRDARQIVLRPLVTEKATTLKDDHNQVSFQVAIDANKIEVRRAIETIFRVKVTGVRTQVVFGKMKRMGRHVGRKASWKKAIVTLGPGSKIDLFES